MRIIYLFVGLFFLNSLIAQDNNNGDSIIVEVLSTQNQVSEELKFINYLITNTQYNDALFALEKLQEENKNISVSQLDSINYYIGWIHYFNKRFGKAITAFEKVSNQTEIYFNSKFYTAFCYAYTQNFNEAWEVLINLRLDTKEDLKDFHNFQLACVALLKRDLKTFEQLASKFKYSNYNFAKEEEQLLNYYNDVVTSKKKSGFLAAIISAVFPGMGKLYAGYKGLPFGALLTNLPLAAVAAETLIKGGWLSPQFFIAGTLFSIFYVGNIWGSALSVNAIKKEFYAEINYNILFDMHIPLRRTFE